MRLVKQVSLFFSEGNSDKVYEIDLCDAGNEQYVVNFRYGRRGAVLKEGSKTPEPLSLDKAENIYNSLEAEKRAKGYHLKNEPAGIAIKPAAVEPVAIPDINWQDWPEGREKAVLKRLQLAIEGKESLSKHPWKTSRVIWMAGVLRLEAAVPFIINLAGKGNAMQQYAAVWALGRLKNETAIPLLQSYFAAASPISLKRIAGEALLHVLKGEAYIKHIQHFVNSLPEPVKLAVQNDQPEQLDALIMERVVNQVQPHYNMLEDLYAVAADQKWIKQSLKKALLQLPLKPSYFRHIRHIYKLAELRDDFEILGLLSGKIEREEEMFQKTGNGYSNEVFVASLGEYIETRKELAKKTSRIAYSNATRQYLRNRTMRMLNGYGNSGNLNYVRMATGLLLSYEHERDYAKPFTSSYYRFSNGRYQQFYKQFPANSRAVFLNQVLYGNAANMQLQSNNLWAITDPATNTPAAKKSNTSQPAAGNQEPGLLKKIFSFLGGKKKEPPRETLPVVPSALKEKIVQVAAPSNDAPFIDLWNQLPQAYVQLLLHARMNEVHGFALGNLEQHEEYGIIKEKLDNDAIELLLVSDFDTPANFGYKLAQERYNPLKPDTGLVKALLYSRLPVAREMAINWVNEKPAVFFEDSEWVCSLLFCPHTAIRKWLREKMITQNYTPVQAQLICGRVISTALALKLNNDANNSIVEDAGETIIHLFRTTIEEVSLHVSQDLLKSPVAAVQVLGLQTLILKKGKINYDDLSNEIFEPLLGNSNQSVREKGLELLQQLSTTELLKRQELVINCCVTVYHNVREGIRPVLKRMSEADPSFGTHAVNWLLPYLLRKESAEGLHKDVGNTLENDLIGFINDADKEMVLRLVYSDYIPAQKFGIAILEKYIDPETFTIRQIIALGNHETLAIRQWCWKYFGNHPARIKFEREEAIRLLDSKWDDTRAFAKIFFKENFSENDWSPETLVGIADSVRPDIEAYGRELITKFFADEYGVDYLLKLSQHPGEKMQLFATNYMERFAAGNTERLEALDLYFRTVLTRVNKARIAKNRVFQFLLKEGQQSEVAAIMVSKIITNVSATVSIADKAKCIEIMYALNRMYKLNLPMTIHAAEERV